MKKLVVAGVLGLAALMSLQGTAYSMLLLKPNMPAQTNAASATAGAPLVLVQSGDDASRIQQLEEQIRSLNGRIEEMSFQLLQMQETIRKAQEDNEFRFQDIEKGKKSGSLEKPVGPAATDDVAKIIEQPPLDTSGSTASTTPNDTAAAQPTLGAIELDANGNPVKATINPEASTGSGAAPDASAATPQQTASLGSETDAYQAAYGHVLSGDYSIAEQEFQSFITTYPSSAKAADANFWLGEALYSQGKYNDAAKTFLNAHQNYAKSAKAPEMLLKLGMSLAALDNKDTACATLREVPKRYPSASKAVLGKVTSEQKRLAC